MSTLRALWLMATLAGIASPADAADRSAQWRLMSKGKEQVAVFLSWDLNTKVFEISCEQATKSLLVIYHRDEAPPSKRDEDRIIGFSKTEQPDPKLIYRAKDIKAGLFARVPVSDRLLETLRPSDADLMILARNAMGEPWYVGAAEPLYSVARGCA